jgi:non-ribosomal peptide synthetase component F
MNRRKHSFSAAMTAFNQESLLTLSPADRHLFSTFGLGAQVELPFDCVHHAFEFYAQQYPNNVAVEDIENKINYGELDRQANILANRLRSAGVAPGARVCLLVERSIFMVVGIIAILKAGAGYVPLDGNVVADKTLNHALRDSGSSLVLVQRKFTHRVEHIPQICLEDAVGDTSDPSLLNKPQDLATPNDSAYIIYTSGAYFPLVDFHYLTSFRYNRCTKRC